ncbi:MAG: hypothetical protein QHH74_03410 [Spirochaetota bacterium]|nr:hypothetical protein [Spirochaetota bacterium]
MRKNKISIMFLILFVASKIYAADLGVGISVWYADWKMESKTLGTFNLEPALFVGPTISYQFEDKWSITLIALATVNKYDQDISANDSVKYRRYDVDCTLNYQISRYIKCFAGIKYLAFDFNSDNYNGINHGVGPGAGIGFSFPIVSSIYLLGIVSGIYGYGLEKTDNPPAGSPDNRNFYSFGINSSLQLAYYIQAIETTISAGYRYQYIQLHYLDYGTDEDSKYDNHFRGFTASVAKSF